MTCCTALLFISNSAKVQKGCVKMNYPSAMLISFNVTLLHFNHGDIWN